MRILVRPLLVSGMIGKEPATESTVLLVNSEQPHEEQAIAFWHELLHAALGPPWIGHNEDWIEEKARILASQHPDVWPIVRARRT